MKRSITARCPSYESLPSQSDGDRGNVSPVLLPCTFSFYQDDDGAEQIKMWCACHWFSTIVSSRPFDKVSEQNEQEFVAETKEGEKFILLLEKE